MSNQEAACREELLIEGHRSLSDRETCSSVIRGEFESGAVTGPAQVQCCPVGFCDIL